MINNYHNYMETTLRAFHGDSKIKAKYVSRVEAHTKADEIIKGTYWENGKGCAVGCTIEGSDHRKYETELGIPRIIANLEDTIFEGLTNEEAKKFPLKFLQSIKVGADLSLVWPQFAVWLLVDKKDGVLKFAQTDVQKYAITNVANLYNRVIKGETVDINTWKNAAAYAASASASYAASSDAAAAAYAASAYAASSDAAAYAASASASYAAYAAAAYAASASHFQKCAVKLIELLKDAPCIIKS